MKNKITLLLTALLISVLFASALGGSSAGAAAQPAAGVRWEATVKLQPEAAKLALQDRSTLTDAMRMTGISSVLGDGSLSMKGQKDMAQISTALFDTASPWMDFLGGTVELTIHLASEGKPVTLNLEARNTTGYVWEVQAGEGVFLQVGESTFNMRYRGVGVPSIQTIRLAATRTGEASIRLLYHRPWESKEEPHAQVSLWMTRGVSSIDLSDPTPAALMDEKSMPVEESNVYEELDELKTALPASFDWRTKGIVPAVRNQGSCGSCWAFGTMGVMESAVKKAGGPMTDLSEQFLVSCNKDGWSCNGGLTATKYHYNVLGYNQSVAGAVLESVKPYTATNGSCTVAYRHPYKASGWDFVSPGEGEMATVTQIKNAIYKYGPVTVRVCADSGWGSYSGGVYAPTSNGCPWYGSPSINHQVILVGWNDANQTWILRNSWGTSWGDNGYMYIKWDTTGTKSRVGEGTSWVRYSASAPTPTPISPTGTITDRTPTFTWRKITGATQYQFQVYRGTTLLYAKIVPSSACNTTNCTNTPKTVLSYAAHKWRVRAYVGGVWKSFSAYKNFTASSTVSGINSTFNGSSTGWSAAKGTWRVYSSMYYRSNGLTDKFASAKHTGTYGNYTYEVRMKRTGDINSANNIIIRGKPTAFDSYYYLWKPSYVFEYTNGGHFSVWEITSTGTAIALKSWTISAKIVKNSWNTLKVVANGTALRFYINRGLVWSGTDPTLRTGQVGFGFYRETTAGTLLVDWAKLTPIAADTLFFEDPFEVVLPGMELPGGDITHSP